MITIIKICQRCNSEETKTFLLGEEEKLDECIDDLRYLLQNPEHKQLCPTCIKGLAELKIKLLSDQKTVIETYKKGLNA